MNLKKIAAFALCAALAGGALAGCSSTATTNTNANTNANAAATTGVSASDVKEVAMKYITCGDANKELMSDGVVFVDVRKAADYQAGHIPGAISIDMDAAKGGDITGGLASMKAGLEAVSGISKDSKLIFICYSGKSYAQAATNIASALGYTNLLTLEGGMKQWTADYANGVIPAGITTSSDVEMKYITVADAKDKTTNSDYVFLDVRKADDYKAGHIENSLSADLDSAKGGATQEGAERLAKALLSATGAVNGNGKNIVLICYSGKSYAQAGTNILKAIDSNIANVVTLQGGMKEWTSAGNATVK